MYEWTLVPEAPKKKDKKTEEEESKEVIEETEENCLKISYKLSVLPD